VQRREGQATHLVLVKQLESDLETAIVEGAHDVSQVGLEVEERAQARVLEHARLERRAREAREAGERRVEGDVGRRNELAGRSSHCQRQRAKGIEERRSNETTHVARPRDEGLGANVGEGVRRLVVRARAEVAHAARDREALVHGLAPALLGRLDGVLRGRDHAGEVDGRRLALAAAAGGLGALEGRLGLDDVVAHKGVVCHVERDLDDAEAHLEDVVRRGAELAALGVRAHGAGQVSRAVLEAGEVAVAHLQARVRKVSGVQFQVRQTKRRGQEDERGSTP